MTAPSLKNALFLHNSKSLNGCGWDYSQIRCKGTKKNPYMQIYLHFFSLFLHFFASPNPAQTSQDHPITSQYLPWTSQCPPSHAGCNPMRHARHKWRPVGVPNVAGNYYRLLARGRFDPPTIAGHPGLLPGPGGRLPIPFSLACRPRWGMRPLMPGLWPIFSRPLPAAPCVGCPALGGPAPVRLGRCLRVAPPLARDPAGVPGHLVAAPGRYPPRPVSVFWPAACRHWFGWRPAVDALSWVFFWSCLGCLVRG